MGYRSNVVALLYAPKDGFSSLKLFIDEHFPFDKEREGFNLTMFETEDLKGFKMEESDIKWYDSFSSVQKFYAFVEAYKELLHGVPMPWHYEFIRIGEETDDIEVEQTSDCYYLLAISRSIESEV